MVSWLLYCGIIWISLFIILKIIEYSQYRYKLYYYVNNLNLDISIGYIKWHTEYFNDYIVYFVRGSNSKQKFFSIWFAVGTIISILLSIGSLVLLFYNLFSIIYSQPGDQPIMTPLVPGVNIPVSQMPYLFLSLLISAIFHELGHAMAAANLRKEFLNIGMFIFFIFPGAFVSFIDEFEDLSPVKRLKIYCAGAWHNVIIVLIAFFLSVTLTFWISPLYTYNEGASVIVVDENSPLHSHLKPYDTIVSLNGCKINNSQNWIECLSDMLDPEYVNSGYCVPNLATKITDENELECCEEDYLGGLQCFSTESNDNNNTNQNSLKYCLSARQVITQPTCSGNEYCPESMQCLFPKISENETLMKVELKNDKFVIFLGHPSLIYSYTKIVDYIPKYEFLTKFNVHLYLEMLLYYLISVSSALAILNMAPVYLLDGQWAIISIIDILLPKHSQENKTTISKTILNSISTLFILNLIASTVIIFL